MSFQRNKNPLDSIGIGKKVQIENWFKEWVSYAKFSINDNLEITVYNNLDLSNSDVSWLPDNLTVNGWLDIRGTDITKLSENLKVKYGIYSDFANLSEDSNFELRNIKLITKVKPLL